MADTGTERSDQNKDGDVGEPDVSQRTHRGAAPAGRLRGAVSPERMTRAPTFSALRVASAVHWLGRSAPWTSAEDQEAAHDTGLDVAYRTPRQMPEPVSRRRRRGTLLLALDLFTLGLAVVANALGASAADAAVGPAIWLVLYLGLTIAVIAVRHGYRFRLKTSPFEYVGQILGATAVAATLIITARVVLSPDPDAAEQVVRIWAFSTVYLISGRVAAELAARRPVRVAFSNAPHHVMLSLVRRCRALDLDVSLVPRLFEEMSRRVTIEHVGGIALARVDRTDPRGWQFECKYAIDRILGVTLLALTAPLMLSVALAVKLSSPGPVFFRQRRVGLDDREFDILKFRTMRVGGDRHVEAAQWIAQALGDEAALVARSEDRRTTVGRFLRRTSLDELPQLLNIVRGEMSFIGPRPERTAPASTFGQHVYRYGDRHRVKSGLTGWAQVNGLRGQTSLQDRIEWDNVYIENWSPWFDLKILLLTPGAILRYD